MAKKKTVEKKEVKPIERRKVLCFTGHRPGSLPCKYSRDHACYKSIKERLLKVLIRAIEHGFTHFLTGMALGFDQWALECLLELRAKDYTFTVVAAVPCAGQESKWPKESQDHYKALLKACDKVVYVTKTPYDDGCMELRNRFMVDNSEVVVALYNDSQGGGTANCVKYAKEKKRHIYRIHPIEAKLDGWLKY